LICITREIKTNNMKFSLFKNLNDYALYFYYLTKTHKLKNAYFVYER
jgi:hypothetical protein